MLINASFTSKSVFTPTLNMAFGAFNMRQGMSEELAAVVLKEEPNILNKTTSPDINDSQWLTSRLWQYNFLDLDYDVVRELRSFIKNSYISYMNDLDIPTQKVYIQCWANVIRNDGRRIVPHHHADGHSNDPNASQEYAYLSGNICVQTKDTNTYFQSPFLNKQVISVPNINGEMVFFPSFITHWTDTNINQSERITISFDLITEEFFNMVDGTNYREL